MGETVQVVWFKRDLRVRDHAPLASAVERGPVLPLYLCEPSVMAAPDYAGRHWRFVADCLAELSDVLASLGSPLRIVAGEAVDVFEALARRAPLAIWAHEETGNGLTYARDRAVRAWARERGVPFTELPNGGVVRRLRTRDVWDATFEARMAEPVVQVPIALRAPVGFDDLSTAIPSAVELGLPPDAAEIQSGGRHQAECLMRSFLTERGREYTREMSSPVTAFDACSRLSPHLAYGTVSNRECLRAVRRRMVATGDFGWLRSLRSLESRLHWRDHFMQKLEDEPEIERLSFIRTFDAMRDPMPHPEGYAAWAEGRTGYPMVDACMRCLIATGWINFRMRAMLTSFAVFPLWTHWHEPALHLARLFTDYEPGIHYPQIQMQSGTASVGTVRLYNPTKQGIDQDPAGEFIARWVPELAGVPILYRFEPWRMPESVQRAAGCRMGRQYPYPVVDHDAAMRRARSGLAEYRHLPETLAQAEASRLRHGSRAPIRLRPSPQKVLDLGLR